MGAYTMLTIVAVVAVVAYELLVAKTGIFRTRSYWISMAIVAFFQVLVDGWLTKRSAPIVIYDPDSFSGLRIAFHSPLEDFGFGFALVTLTMVVWDQLGRRSADGGVASLPDDRAGEVHRSAEP
jgi:lycopene cyclase domain-containing protein